MKKEKLYVDAVVGGSGDLWMRLVGFYSMAKLKPNLEIYLYVNDTFRPFMKLVFGDRLIFVETKPKEMKLTYTGIGLRHLIPGIIKGERYIAPFQRIIVAERKHKSFKDSLNIFLFGIMDNLSLIHVPPEKVMATYHGYLETAGIKKLRDISLETFSKQVNEDYPILYDKLNAELPLSPELQIPNDINENIVFFANGNSRQFAPLWWAKENFPNAYYAFFYKEPDFKLFQDAGMKVIPFYKEIGDMIEISKRAKWTVCTDSFSSHVIQSSNKNCTILITEVVPSRVISPAFKGPVVDNEVACHPCVHSNRRVPCEAGLFECLNWKNSRYTENIKKSIPQ